MAELRITELDFEQLKENFKTFLRDKPEYTDFDFDGSGWSVLLDVLAYNTHINAFIANFAANESHLTSAFVRNCVVARAKELGYTPRSKTAARAYLSLTAESSAASSTTYSAISSVQLEVGKKFLSNLDGKSFEFVVLKPYVLERQAGSGPIFTYATTEAVELVQGDFLTYFWSVDTQQPDQRFIIPNDNVDISTLTVSVQKSSVDASSTVFSLADTFVEFDSDNNAYWIWETDDGKYELEFGDGVLAKMLDDGNIIKVTYVVTDGKDANKCNTFTYPGTIGGITKVTPTLFDSLTPAYGGADRETIESIKFNSVRQYAAQKRAVTQVDYEAILLEKFTAAEAIAVWGGETQIPPQYGKVYISIKLADGLVLTQTIKDQIINDILAPYTILSITPVIVEPEYLQLVIDTDIRYNRRLTSKSINEIEIIVKDAVSKFSSTNIGKFNQEFLYSQFLGDLIDSDASIINGFVTINFKKKFEAEVEKNREYIIKFDNPIKMGSLSCTGFVVADTYVPAVDEANPTYILRDVEGTIKVFRVTPTGESLLSGTASSVGTVDYETGVVTLNGFIPSAIFDPTNSLFIEATPQNPDITVSTNSIIKIDDADVTVNVEAVY